MKDIVLARLDQAIKKCEADWPGYPGQEGLNQKYRGIKQGLIQAIDIVNSCCEPPALLGLKRTEGGPVVKIMCDECGGDGFVQSREVVQDTMYVESRGCDACLGEGYIVRTITVGFTDSTSLDEFHSILTKMLALTYTAPMNQKGADLKMRELISKLKTLAGGWGGV